MKNIARRLCCQFIGSKKLYDGQLIKVNTIKLLTLQKSFSSNFHNKDVSDKKQLDVEDIQGTYNLFLH